MAETQNNVALLHRKEWQTMMPVHQNSSTAYIMVADQSNQSNIALYMTSATVHYLYHHDEDDFIQIPSGAFGGTYVAGVSGVYHPWSRTYTATGGTTTTVTVNVAAFNINGFARGKQIEFLSGTAANIGLRRTITEISIPGTATGTITLTLDSAVTGAVANNDTFRISSGRFFVMASGTLAANCFKEFDPATYTWTDKAYATGGTTNGTDSRLISPYILDVSYDSGTAEADTSSSTTLTCTGKTWATDQWKNYQVRITAGTGKGQVRVITGNDADTLTVASWTAPDDTSTFVIEGDENAIYYMGNGAVTMYKYSISGNSWSNVVPSVSRAGAPAAGMTGDFVGVSGDSVWANTSAIRDGRYIYSFRGGATGTLDRYDIASQAWEVMSYGNTLITLSAGSYSCWDGRYIYIAKESSATVPIRIYKYSVRGNYLEPVTSDWFLAGAAVHGNRMWIKSLSSANTVKWLYYIAHTAQIVRRIMIF